MGRGVLACLLVLIPVASFAQSFLASLAAFDRGIARGIGPLGSSFRSRILLDSAAGWTSYSSRTTHARPGWWRAPSARVAIPI